MKEIEKKENNFPSVHWEKFFNRFSEIETVPIQDWKQVHLLAYFSKKYKDHYGLSYTFKFNSTSPSKSFEIFRLNALSQMLSSDPTILKDYFDWFFETKIILKKRRITSLAFITDANSANEYKFKKLAMNKETSITRTTSLPPQYISVISSVDPNCKTYGDLAFLFKTIKSEKNHHHTTLTDQLTSAGLDISILNKVS